jgi:hypothetical protein
LRTLTKACHVSSIIPDAEHEEEISYQVKKAVKELALDALGLGLVKVERIGTGGAVVSLTVEITP